jgi:hypothetical protein
MAAEIKFKDRVQPEEAAKYKCRLLIMGAGEDRTLLTKPLVFTIRRS